MYLHIPFCRSRCGYCDFNTYAGLEALLPDYIRALCTEIEFVANRSPERIPVHTIFIGGGTPSLVPPKDIEHVMRVLTTCFEFTSNIEITLEANPGTVSSEYFREIRKSGVNRLSLGVQSTNTRELKLLERQHNHYDVIQAVSWARHAGFDNINLDLIYGIPYQTLPSWLTTLERVLDLEPDHLSLYALTLEQGTPMKRWIEHGMLENIDPDQQADMYEAATDILDRAGFSQYEISNWARRTPDGGIRSCQHNLQYWHALPYFGFGAGAHGYVSDMRIANISLPQDYIFQMVNYEDYHSLAFPLSPATVKSETIDNDTAMAEFMILGLRLILEGVSEATFYQRFHLSLRTRYGEVIDQLINLKLVEWVGAHCETLRLSQQGRLLGNQVFMEFI